MAAKHYKIAVIEDDEPIAAMYTFKLDQEGFETRRAIDGRQGLVLAKTFLPDLILLDIRMPIMSGDKMLQELRSYDWGADIRIIILTNISKSEAPHALRFLSVDRYVVKAHSTPSQIVEIVKEVLGD
jgi:DNA-binding response OmpR family regulator